MGINTFHQSQLHLNIGNILEFIETKKKLILYVNKLAKDKNYYSISGIQPSRNHKFIAYGEDLNGIREYSIVV